MPSAHDLKQDATILTQAKRIAKHALSIADLERRIAILEALMNSAPGGPPKSGTTPTKRSSAKTK